jgi:hypothetical protein
MGPSPRLELRFVSDAPPQSSYDCLPRFPLSDLEPPTFTPLPARLGPPCCETCESHIIYGNYAVRLIKINLVSVSDTALFAMGHGLSHINIHRPV